MSLSPQSLPMLATGASAAGSYIGGKQDEKILRLQAIVAREQGYADEQAKRRENRAFRGAQAAALAENGLTGDGSSADAISQDAALAELDALNIRYGGLMKSASLTGQARAAGNAGSMLAGAQILMGGSDYWRRRKTGGY